MIKNPKLKEVVDNLNVPYILMKHKRIAVVGGPKTGKSAIAEMVKDRPVFHSDSEKTEWENAPKLWIDKTKGHDSFVMVGIHAARAVRKGLPVDAIIHMKEPMDELKPGQKSMVKGQATVLKDIKEKYPHIEVYE